MVLKKDIVDDFVSSLVNSDSIKKAGVKRRRDLFSSEIKKTVSRINATAGSSPNLEEASEILNTASRRLNGYDLNGKNYLGKEDEAVQLLGRAYGALLLGLNVIKDSPDEQPQGEVRYFLDSVRKDLLENYKKIVPISKDYLGLRQDPLFVLEKNAVRSLKSNFAYSPNKDLLESELRNIGVDVKRSSARRAGLEGKSAYHPNWHKINQGHWDKVNKDLTSRFFPTLAITSLLGSIFFLSNNIIGNVIVGYSSTTANISGVVLFMLAIFLGYLYFKKKV